jgi:hypothetical protein
MLVAVEEKSKDNMGQGQESLGETNCWFFIFCGAFPSDHIPKATNRLMRQKFFSCSNSCKLY